jgi:prepilin-type N-terminal cleavage/methylation domain-containing protein
MRTLSVGRIKDGRSLTGFTANAGVTLIELLIVVALIALMVGISFPAFSSGVDSLRLNQATNGVATFFNSALNRSIRRQQVVEVAISKAENMLTMRSSDAGFERHMEMPEGVTITAVLPALVDENGTPAATRSFFLYPGGTVPQFGVRLMNRRNVERIVSVDPMTGVPHVETP